MAVLLSTSCFAQQQVTEPRVSLDEVSVFAGESAVLPFRVAQAPPLRGLAFTFSFPPDLTFVEARPGRSAGKIGVTIEPAAARDATRSVLRLRATSETELAGGRVLDLVFQTSKETYSSEDFEVALADVVLDSFSGGTVERPGTKNGHVIVKVPLFSCFLYMH
jgi:hypothetical protein